MEIGTMGKVVAAVKIENLADQLKARDGLLSAEQVRHVEVADALADTEATMLSVPKRLIQQLGLQRHRTRTAKTSAGVFSFGVYEPVRLTVMDRDCVVEVLEITDDCPVLIGQIPLEALDLVVDPAGRRLIGNPEHDGEHVIEVY